MKILVTNDDGISAEGLWILVKELKSIAQVAVVAPDRERSAIGTAVTLRQPLRIQKVEAMPAVETYAVEGTPSDSVILALGKLIQGKIDLVVSGINNGHNLGEDAHISGTVGAALQGYLHGFHALAVSVARGSDMDAAARVAALLAKRITSDSLPTNIFLNVNLPNLPLARIGGARITQLARKSHINTVEERDENGSKCYWLMRQETNKTKDEKTDIWAIEQGNISITPLHTNLSSYPLPFTLDNLCADLLQELKKC